MASEKKPGAAKKRAGKRSQSKSGRSGARANEGAAATRRAAKRTIPLIAGIGASAGGLEAFMELLRHLPTESGMAFVLVQHLDPERASALVDLLAKATSLPVLEAASGQAVEADHVYIIPPDRNLTIAKATLRLEQRPKAPGPNRSIDVFLESLAQDQGGRAVGVLLSGTASDGTMGLEAIKAEGGITFAQDESARYDSMPRSAIAAGCVDFVLKPEDIAKELGRIAKHPFVAGQPVEAASRPERDRESAEKHEDDDTALPSGGHGSPRTGAKQARDEAAAGGDQPAEAGFKKILLLLRNHCGVDFSLYKSSTIQRRITRRMVLNRQDRLEDYASFLRGNVKELDALYSDVLISVTSFFRNPEAFDILKRKVFPKLFHQRDDEPLRVWVLGCSTGQEAYSIVMTFMEAVEKAPRARRLQVFATDLNEALLDKARHGLYARSLAQDIAPERLRRFFVEEEGGYRISKQLREMVVFARQNLISDPPFSRMDLVSCRNLMIYLEPGLQRTLLPAFHYALKPEGFLFLGASESVGGFTDLFEPLDKKHKIYSRKIASTPPLHLPVRKMPGEHAPRATAPQITTPFSSRQEQAESEGLRAERNALREADRVTVSRYAPPAVLVSADLQIVQFRGATSAYLEPPVGKASFDVLKMVRDGLMLPLRAAINKARKENKVARKESIQVRRNGESRSVNIEVIPLKNLRERCYLILFDDGERAEPVPKDAPRTKERAGKAAGRAAKAAESRRVAEVERELAETRDYLQSVQEQHEAANEELQAAGEEVQSANEELQSINEELETSKEELESANEELTTVNEEMTNRNVELNRLNSDLVNLQTSTRLAIVLLDRDLTIRRFSAQAAKQFNLLASDVRRPLANVRHNLDMADLENFAGEVISTVREREREVRDQAGRWYSLRVRPYFTLDNRVDGVVLVLVDIDEIKRSQLLIAEARDHNEAIIRTVPDPLLILHADLRAASANDAFYRTFKLAAAEVEGRLIFDLDRGAWNIPALRELLEGILPRNSYFNDFEVVHDFDRLGLRTMLLNARSLRQADGNPARILLGFRDVTEVLAYQAKLRQSEARKDAILRSALDAIIIMDHEGRFVELNPAAEAMFGYPRATALGRPVAELIIPEYLRERHRRG
jgi:two-component system CheB/CheR fusion protein